MTSEPTEAFVWTWLPGAEEPVVAGRLELTGGIVDFNYGRSYLDSPDAIPLYLPELPLRQGRIAPIGGLTMAGCIKDAGPDAWGQRVVMQTKTRRSSARSPISCDRAPTASAPSTSRIAPTCMWTATR
jgi:serine/threonine-protein kinase HipA